MFTGKIHPMPIQEFFGASWNELRLAKRYREEGLEGRARVCARRALGKAIKAYRSSIGDTPVEGNVLCLVPQLLEDPEIPSVVHQKAVHFLTHVNSDHELPAGIDLIQEAEDLIHFLFSRIEA